AADREDVEKKIAALKEALKGADVAVIRSASEELAQAAQKIGQAMYAQQPAGGEAAGDQTAQAAGGDEVVDAEVVDEGQAG
ncbi:MAG: molecular chaperone DnaK, partial [Acidobacteria bacterium]|nr:molecular chaperone DnaK [Acidobacteriota bacterium]